MTANPHDHVEIGLLMRFEGLGLLDVPPQTGIVGHCRHLASDKFRKVVRCRRGGEHVNLYTVPGVPFCVSSPDRDERLPQAGFTLTLNR